MNVITQIIIFREDIITHKTDQIDLWYYEFKFKNLYLHFSIHDIFSFFWLIPHYYLSELKLFIDSSRR